MPYKEKSLEVHECNEGKAYFSRKNVIEENILKSAVVRKSLDKYQQKIFKQ